RPQEIALIVPERGAPAGANILAGMVQRTSYLWDAVDYQVRVDGSDVVLRVTVPPPARFGAGDAVTLAVAPEARVPLPGSDVGGENRTFLGEENLLRARGVAVEVVQDVRCQELMARFIQAQPALWAEDIGDGDDRINP